MKQADFFFILEGQSLTKYKMSEHSQCNLGPKKKKCKSYIKVYCKCVYLSLVVVYGTIKYDVKNIIEKNPRKYMFGNTETRLGKSECTQTQCLVCGT